MGLFPGKQKQTLVKIEEEMRGLQVDVSSKCMRENLLVAFVSPAEFLSTPKWWVKSERATEISRETESERERPRAKSVQGEGESVSGLLGFVAVAQRQSRSMSLE